MRITRVAVALTAFLLLSAAAHAARSGVWTQAGIQSFYDGAFKTTALTSDGAVVLAPKVDEVFSSSEPYLWSIALDATGGLWAGSGLKAVLYRVDKAKKDWKEEVSFLPGSNVTAVMYDPKGFVYAAGFSPGAVYKFGTNNRKDIVADLPARYVWDMLTGKGDRLIVATGLPAAVYSIDKNAAGTKDKPAPPPTPLFTSSTETHILSLALDPEGNIYAGTAPNGLIVKIAADGKVSVLHDLEEDEAYKLIWLGGRLIAAGNYAQPGTQQAPGPPQAPPKPEPKSFQSPPSNVPKAAVKPANLYEIMPTGKKRHLLQTDDPFILALMPIDNEHVYVGTGNEGRLYRLNVITETAVMTQLPANQILDIATDRDRFYFSTGTPGAVFAMDGSPMAAGEFESTINDIGATGAWGRVWIEADTPTGAGVAVSTRTGNTPHPDETWSQWSPAWATMPHIVDSPPGRYIQYKASLSVAANAKSGPALREVNISFIPPNRPPDILELKVLPEPAMLDAPPPAPQQGNGPPPQGPPPPQPPQPPSMQRNVIIGTVRTAGAVTIRWSSIDPDKDPLIFSLFFRRIPNTAWTLLDDEITAFEQMWDTRTIPDGKYEVKLVVSDEKINPITEAETEFEISTPFIIDNGNPEFSKVEYKPLGRGAIEIRGVVADSASVISGIEYSLDEIDWKPVAPADRIFDSTSEDFRFSVGGLAAGPHVMLLRARDYTGNAGSFELRINGVK